MKITHNFFKRLFVDVDRYLSRKKVLYNGCNATTLLIEIGSDNEIYLVVSNIGDSRLVLSINGVA